MGKLVIDQYKKDCEDDSPYGKLIRAFSHIMESHLKCPFCNGLLWVEFDRNVMDGNSVYHCENHNDHTFWRNARERSEILHYNKRSSSTDWDAYGDYVLKNNIWKQIKVKNDFYDLAKNLPWKTDLTRKIFYDKKDSTLS